MRALSYGAILAVGLITACAPDGSRVDRAGESVRKEEQKAREDVSKEAGEAQKEIGQAAQKGEQDVAAARRDFLDRLHKQEASGEAVELDGVVVNTTANMMTVRVDNGETLDINHGPGSHFERGGETVTVDTVKAGTPVHVTYRMANGKRMLDVAEVQPTDSGGAAPGTAPPRGTTTTPRGGGPT
jgi:hypothetical protein